MARNIPAFPCSLSRVIAFSIPPPGCTATPLLGLNPGQDEFMLQAPTQPFGVGDGAACAAVAAPRAATNDATASMAFMHASFQAPTARASHKPQPRRQA